MRVAVLAAALAFCGLFTGLTVFVLVTSGPSVLVLVAVLVLAVLVFGVAGALR